MFFGGLFTNGYIAYWVYEDLERKNKRQLKWIIFTFFTGIVGLLLYLALRKSFKEVDIFEGKVKYNGLKKSSDTGSVYYLSLILA